MRPCCVVFLTKTSSLSLITGKKSLMHFSGNCSFLGIASRLAEFFVFFASKKVQDTKNSSTRSRDKLRFFHYYDITMMTKREFWHVEMRLVKCRIVLITNILSVSSLCYSR